MVANTTCAGECIYDNFKLEYQIVSLEFIRDKSLTIEAICYNKKSKHIDKEMILKYRSSNLSTPDGKQKIVLSILFSLMKNLNLQKEKLHKLVVRNNQVYYICDL